MALARLPATTRAVARHVTPMHVISACTLVLVISLVLLQVGLLQPALQPLLGGGEVNAPLPAGDDWTQYRFDISGTGATTESALTSATVGKLQQRWMLTGFAGFESTPAVVGGVVYVTNGNSLYAFDLRTGKQLWHHDDIPQQVSAVSSSVAVDPAAHLAYYGAPDARMYAVDTRAGALVWVTQLSPDPGAHIWSSPLLVNHKLYIGLASHDDDPCVRGAIFALDPASGSILWVHHTVARGELGGGVWSTLAADPAHNEVIATSGNPCPVGPSDFEQDAIIGLDWNTGATNWRYIAVPEDNCDCDFGEGPTVFTYQGHEYIVAGNKYGRVYGLRRDASGKAQILWSVRITSPSSAYGKGAIYEPPTYGDGLVYISGGPTLDGVCQGALWAFHPDSGQLAWRVCTAQQVISPAALVGDVLFVAQTGVFVAYEASTGRVLAKLRIDGAVFGGVAVSHGQVLVGTVSGKLYCYHLP